MSYSDCRCNNGHVDCFKCSGNGNIDCPVCARTGNVSCRKCSGNGTIGCPVCRQTGTVSCRKCEGDGEIGCPVCHESGNLSCRPCGGDGTLTCRKCEGNGNIDCPVCEGTGTYADSGRPCRVCEGGGRVKCRKCDGDGTVTCRKCEGGGTVTCYACQGSLKVSCRRCDGSGKSTCYLCEGSLTAPCRKCEGSGEVTCFLCEGSLSAPCKKCEGSGQLTCTKCEGSGKLESSWETKRCEWREGCSNEIRYNSERGFVPTFCKFHSDELKRIKAEREAFQAKIHTKPCPGCGKTIKWHQDKKEYDYCFECNKDLFKQCEAQDCSEQIRYKKYWNPIPDYCRKCKSGEREITVRYMKDGLEHVHTGRGYINKNGFAVFTDKGSYGKHSHEVYYADGRKKGERDQGDEKDFKREDQGEYFCERCNHSFTYDLNKKKPRWCRDCYPIVQEEWEEQKRQREEKKNRQETTSCIRCGKDVEYPANWITPPEYCSHCYKLIKVYKSETIQVDNKAEYERDHIADEYLRRKQLVDDIAGQIGEVSDSFNQNGNHKKH